MKICPVCERKVGNKYAIYCSLSCGNVARARRERDKYYENPLRCLQCKGAIPYNKKSFIKFCSRRCSGMWNMARRERKPFPVCGNCGVTMKYRESVCCSRKCSDELLYKKFIENWKSGKESGVIGFSATSRCIKKYLQDTRGDRCEKCGWAEVNPTTGKVPIQLEHADGNWQNNVEGNLLLLCPNCHSLTPTFGSLNRGKGRKYRRKEILPEAPDGGATLS